MGTQPDIGPPHFVGVGAQRAGTTWWFRLLLEHPGIVMPERRKKELHFFNRFCTRELLPADVERYYREFPRRRKTVSGEWTPRYMYDPWTPRLIARIAPEAKILVLLRDPIERFRSGRIHQDTFRPDGKAYDIAVDAVNRGRYPHQIRRLWAHFPREQVLVLQYERCRDDPLGEYARTLRFLGLPDDFQPAGVNTPRGRSTESKKEPLWPELAEELRATLEPDVAELQAMLPEIDVSLWPNFAHVAGSAGAYEPAR